MRGFLLLLASAAVKGIDCADGDVTGYETIFQWDRDDRLLRKACEESSAEYTEVVCERDCTEAQCEALCTAEVQCGAFVSRVNNGHCQLFDKCTQFDSNTKNNIYEKTCAPTMSPTMSPSLPPSATAPPSAEPSDIPAVCTERSGCCDCVGDETCTWNDKKMKCTNRDERKSQNRRQSQDQCTAKCPGVDQDCGFFEKKYCKDPRNTECLWLSKIKECRTLITEGCGKYLKKKQCNNSPDNCEWKPKAHICESLPPLEGCALIMEESECGAPANPDCKWDLKKQKCKDVPGDLPPCSDLSGRENKPECRNREICQYIKETEECIERVCENFTEGKECKSYRGCKWDNKAKTCSEVPME